MTKENESYEDPDQTPLSGKEADMQIDLWSCLSKMSAPYSETMCPWARTLTRGDYARMERLLEGIEAEALTHLLEKRESNERISAIVHVILGATLAEAGAGVGAGAEIRDKGEERASNNSSSFPP